MRKRRVTSGETGLLAGGCPQSHQGEKVYWEETGFWGLVVGALELHGDFRKASGTYRLEVCQLREPGRPN
jgi:hypothetical protein